MTKANVKIKPGTRLLKEDEIPHLVAPGEIGAVLEFTVKDSDGKTTEHRVMKSESFVRQFLELLWIQAMQVPELICYDLTDTGNNERSIPESSYVFACDALANDDDFGVVAGTGNTAPDIDDYALETQIAHGVGAGQLQYGAVAFGAPTSDAATSHFTVTRDFSNASGGAITVNEVGLYVKGYLFETGDYYYFMTIRDVISGGIVVPDGQTLTVNYRPQATV